MNLDGPVRVADTAGSGPATVTLSFDNWKGARVAPTTHTLQVLPAKKAARAEPVAPELVATLVHPERKASVWSAAFSPDGRTLFASGYPSGVVQVFDVPARKELRRIDTPPGLRGSADYALVTPDGRTLYVPVEKRVAKSVERDGKTATRLEHSGSVRVWNLTTGTEGEPLRLPEGSAPVYARLSPDGTKLVCIERPSYFAEDRRVTDVTVLWDLAARTRRKLLDGFHVPLFAPDGKTLVVQQIDNATKADTLRVLDGATLKELAALGPPERERRFNLEGMAPDGSVVAVGVGGKKGGPREVWFRDARTLADRGTFVGAADPERYGFGEVAFAPDGKRCAVLGAPGTVAVWDVSGRKVARELEVGGAALRAAFSADGARLAVAWMPKFEFEGRARDPDPMDYPQPRVTVYDLAGAGPPRTFVSKHGFPGAVAFAPDGTVLALASSGGVHLFDLSK